MKHSSSAPSEKASQPPVFAGCSRQCLLLVDGSFEMSYRSLIAVANAFYWLATAVERGTGGCLQSKTILAGVEKGHERKMQLVGVGYRVNVEDENVVLNVGYTNEKKLRIPRGITCSVGRVRRHPAAREVVLGEHYSWLGYVYYALYYIIIV